MPDHSCSRGGTRFASSYNCSCTDTYGEHSTVFESREDRERAGRPVDTGWMEQASREGLPVCHLGGVVGFASLADGIDRMMAGLESDDVSHAVAVRGGPVGDAGAQRFLGRCMLEDEVNTASIVHGKEAGFQAIARAKAKRQPALFGNASNSSIGSRQRAITPGSRMSGGGTAGQNASASSSTPRANVHTLAGPMAARSSCGSAAQPSDATCPGAQRRGSAGEQRGALPNTKASPAPRRSSASVPAPAGGRRLGGARHYDQAAMREARLARLDG